MEDRRKRAVKMVRKRKQGMMDTEGNREGVRWRTVL